MEDARKGLLLEKKKEVILPFFKTFYEAYKDEHGGIRPAFNFGDLLEVPSVKSVLEDMKVQTFPDTLLPELEPELRVILEGRAEKLRSECIADVHEWREEFGLLSFDSIRSQGEDNTSSSTEESKDPATDFPLLVASTVFTVCFIKTYGTPHPDRDITFGKAMELYLDFPYPENVRSSRQPLPWRPKFQKTFAKDAEEILKVLSLPLNVTLAHMDGLPRRSNASPVPNIDIHRG